MRLQGRLIAAMITAGILSAVVAWAGASPAIAKTHTLQILSPTYTIDQVYKSMQGPKSTLFFPMKKREAPELLWITGFRSEMVGEDGKTAESPEFMCHTNLDVDWFSAKRPAIRQKRYHFERIFTLSQGQLEVRFPEGFGFPVVSSESLSLTTQVLNLNPQSSSKRVRHHVTIEYLRDSELTKPMTPLMEVTANGLVLIEGNTPYYGLEKGDVSEHGQGCLALPTMGRVVPDQYGKKFSGHWLVPPGKQENHTLVTEFMRLPYDTTLHYAAVHLHPFATAIELRDLTDKKTLFKGGVEPVAGGKIGIRSVDFFSSRKGVPLYKDHQYELVSYYNNTSGADQDSMAVMYLYVENKTFKKEDPATY